jgi:hypothetical protein
MAARCRGAEHSISESAPRRGKARCIWRSQRFRDALQQSSSRRLFRRIPTAFGRDTVQGREDLQSYLNKTTRLLGVSAGKTDGERSRLLEIS